MKPFIELFTWKELVKLLPKWSKKNNSPGLCCVSFLENGLAIAYVIRQPQQLPILRYCEFISCLPAQMSDVLKAVVKKNQLQGVACSLLLQAMDYQVFPIDPPAVPEEELLSSLRWHIKDMINFPAAEAVLDYFPVATAVIEQARTINVVAARANRLQELTNIVHESGLITQTIDIPELALRNLLACFAEEKEGLGLLWIKAKDSQLVITRQKLLYFNRILQQLNASFLPMPKDMEDLRNILEDFSLEVQRSLDYFQLQLRQGALVKLLLTYKDEKIVNFLSERLAIEKIQLLDLHSIMDYKANFSNDIYIYCLATIAGALREDQVDAATD